MEEWVHIIPVGFDRDRLVLPLTKSEMLVDRVILLRDEVTGTPSPNVELSSRMAELVKRDILMATKLTPSDIIDMSIPRVHDYEEAYQIAYELFLQELGAGNRVLVNISSMPRTVSFAFAAAANQLVQEDETRRPRLVVYYSAPAEYLVMRMVSILVQQVDLMDHMNGKVDLPRDLRGHFDGVMKETLALVDDIHNFGTTKGVDPMGGSYRVEIPFAAAGQLREFEKKLVRLLDKIESVESVTDLAKALAKQQRAKGEELPQIKSKVVYNVRSLVEKGYVEVEEQGRSHRAKLTLIGKLWANSEQAAK